MSGPYLIAEIANLEALRDALGDTEADYLLTRALKRLARDARIGGGNSEILDGIRLAVGFNSLGDAEQIANQVDTILNAVPAAKGMRLQAEVFLAANALTPSSRLQPYTPHGARPVQVRFAGQTVTLDRNNREISIGRGIDNAIIVDNPRVSRHHAILTWSDGHISLSDNSSNSTYIQEQGSAEIVRLSRDSRQLDGNARIAVGMPFASSNDDSLRIEIIFG